MQSTLRAEHGLTHFIPQQPQKVGGYPNLQMRTLKHRDVYCLAHGYTARKEQRKDSTPDI